ncbi:MAG: hypothetical protein Q8862_05810 [Bacteroidota bacterium]|nr:hypothetical protein [Bacteroidota bacterium]
MSLFFNEFNWDNMIGLKDFKSGTDEETEGASAKVEVKSIDIYKLNDLIGIHIIGSHFLFLWKMVRRMVGVIVDAGRAKLSENDAIGMFIRR